MLSCSSVNLHCAFCFYHLTFLILFSNVFFYSFLTKLMEVTGKNQDECMVALHDCNEDVSRAINFLLESNTDMVNDNFR